MPEEILGEGNLTQTTDINERTFDNALIANNIRESAPRQDEISSKHLSDQQDHQQHTVDLLNIQYQTHGANYYNNINTTLFGHQDDQTENNISLNYQHQHQQQHDPMLNPVTDPLLFLTEEFLGGFKFKSESENQSVQETVKSESADEGFGDYLIHSDLEGTLVATSELDNLLYTPIEYKVESSQSPQSDTMSLKSEPQTFDLIEYIAGNIVEFPTTPLVERPRPTFDEFQQQVQQTVNQQPEYQMQLPEIYQQPSTSTSATTSTATSPSRSHRTKRRLPSVSSDNDDSDEDYMSRASVRSTSSSYTSVKTSHEKRKRGRPSKPLMKKLPTIDAPEYRHLPLAVSTKQVLRVKNNEASRKSRMKSRSVQQRAEDECDRLEAKYQFLIQKRLKLREEVDTLHKWLIA